MNLFHYPVLNFRVIDGDTVEAIVDQGFRTRRQETFRLARINAPEMNTPAGKAAKAALDSRLEATLAKITLTSIKTEKYGRWLCELFVGDENVNDWMIQTGHAKEYGK